MLKLTASNLSQIPGISHGFFGRQGGVSEGIFASLNCGPGSGDVREHVIENRQRVVANLAPQATLVTLGQIHSSSVLTVATPWPIGEIPADDPKFIPLGDAMVTKTPGIALGILTADCAPVLFADSAARVIGAAHAGWKGAFTGIVASVLEKMESLGADRARISASVGPCISRTNYEVGPEFIARFAEADADNTRFFLPSDKPDRWRFDLEGYVVHRLREAGLANIEPLSACTYAKADDFFSFRRTTHRDEKDYGRQVSAIVLK